MIRPYGRPIVAGRDNIRGQFHFNEKEDSVSQEPAPPQRRRRSSPPPITQPLPLEDQQAVEQSAPIQEVPENVLKELDKTIRLAIEFPQVMDILINMPAAVRAMLEVMATTKAPKPASDDHLVFEDDRLLLYRRVVDRFVRNSSMAKADPETYRLASRDFPLSKEHLLDFWAKVRRVDGRKHILSKLLGVDFEDLTDAERLELGTKWNEDPPGWVPAKKPKKDDT